MLQKKQLPLLLLLLLLLSLLAACRVLRVAALTRKTCVANSQAYYYDSDTAICNTQLGPLCRATHVAFTQGSFTFPVNRWTDCLTNQGLSLTFSCVPGQSSIGIIPADRWDYTNQQALDSGLPLAITFFDRPRPPVSETFPDRSAGLPSISLARSVRPEYKTGYVITSNTFKFWYSDSTGFWSLKDFRCTQRALIAPSIEAIGGDLLPSTWQNPAALFAGQYNQTFRALRVLCKHLQHNCATSSFGQVNISCTPLPKH